MTSIIDFPLISIAEKFGIPTKIENVLEERTLDLDKIKLYSNEREIYASFFLIDLKTSEDVKEIIFGPLLMSEVSFGLEDAQKSIYEFKQILNHLYVLANHFVPIGFNEENLHLDEYYQHTQFPYNAFSDMDEFYKLELLLFSHIKDRNKIATFQTLNLFIKHYYKHLTPEQLKCFYCGLITLMSRVEIEKGNPVNKVFNKQFQYYSYMQKVEDISLFESLITKAIHDFLNQYSKVPKRAYNPITVYVLNYIENHIEENITLNEICDLLNKDSKYVGKLFYKEIHIHFKDYILMKKIEKSKHYLLFSNKSINEISEELSFSSQSHFSSSFKKLVGTSPQKYKNNRVYYSY